MNYDFKNFSILFLGFTFFIYLSVLDTGYSQAEIQLDAKAVMERALEQNYSIRSQKLAASQTLEDLRNYNALFDPELFSHLSWNRDKKERPSPIFSDSSTLTYGLGARKHFGTGTDIQLGWSHSRVSEDMASLFTTINPYHDTQLELSIRQPFLKNAFGLADRGNQKIIQTSIRRQKTQLTSQIEASTAEILNSYWVLVLAHETVRIRKEALKEAQKLLKIQNRKRQYGLLEDPDVLQTEGNVKRRENDLIRSENNLRNAQELLRTLLAYPKGEVLVPLDPLDLPSHPFNQEEEIANAFESRRDLKQIKDDFNANQIAIRVAKNARYPQLDFVSTLTANGLDPSQVDSIGQAFAFKGRQYFIGGELSFPLLNRSANADFRRASLEKYSLVYQRKDIEDRILLEVGEAVREVRILFELATRNVEIADIELRKFKAQEKKFRQGRSTSDLVNRFLVDALVAHLAAAESKVSFQFALVNLLRVQNRLLTQIDLDDESRRIFR
jgi:outer membrane protein TolC